jgi:hypothetical protein
MVAAVLQAAFLAGGAMVGPGRARPGGGGGQDDPPPPVPRQVQVAVAERHGLRGAQGGVVQAGGDRCQMLPPAGQAPDGSQ